MKEGYIIKDQSLPHFLTAIVIDWIDVLSRKNYRITSNYVEGKSILDV